MRSSHHITFLVVASFAFVLFAHTHTAKAQKESSTSDQKQIVMTVNTLFAAFRADDTQMLNSVVTSDCYIFDGGVRFNEDSLMTLIKAQHAAGKRYEWNVTDPDVHVSGNTASIAYVNKGSVGDLSGSANLAMVGIRLSGETCGHLEDRVYA